MIRVVLPAHLQTLAQVPREVRLDVDTPVTQRRLLDALEARYKEPFAPVGEETLAGGLSNTIAGRICNFFDLGGGGYTLDGACASSLLAVAEACSALSAGSSGVSSP